MNYLRQALYGLIIWAAAFISASAFLYFEFGSSIAAGLVTLAVVAIAAYLLGRTIREQSILAALRHTMIWALAVLVLDLITAYAFIGFGLFSRWDVWVGYLVILVVPLYSAR